MGMDVYGQDPKTEEGEYFRANVWGWRPLWDYCMQVHPHLVGDSPEHGHFNDGYGLDAVSASRLGFALEQDVVDGRAHAYVDARNRELASLDRPDCKYCDATGIRSDEVGLSMGMPDLELDELITAVTGRTHGWCNVCHGEGKTDHPAADYNLDVQRISDFATFLVNSGGFGIH
jgi:hypothetical protein